MENKLVESSLSRLWSHMVDHDSGMITAYRGQYTKKENQQRNKSLLAKLQSKRYGVTSIKGTYVEDYNTPKAKEVGEHTFFVNDLKDTGNLLKDIKELGEFFEQDSVLFIPKGAESAQLHGTNKNAIWPGYGKIIEFNTRKLGSSGEFFSKVGKQPFKFESVLKEHQLPEGMMGRMGCKAVAEQPWKNIEISEDDAATTSSDIASADSIIGGKPIRRQMNLKDGSGKGEGQPGGLRRNKRKPEECRKVIAESEGWSFYEKGDLNIFEITDPTAKEAYFNGFKQNKPQFWRQNEITSEMMKYMNSEQGRNFTVKIDNNHSFPLKQKR